VEEGLGGAWRAPRVAQRFGANIHDNYQGQATIFQPVVCHASFILLSALLSRAVHQDRAMGAIRSVYFRDSDLNLVEVSEYV
jgi:hypothetical protein